MKHEEPCPSCLGTGVAPHDMDCSVCHGSGYVFGQEDEDDLYDFWLDNNE